MHAGEELSWWWLAGVPFVVYAVVTVLVALAVLFGARRKRRDALDEAQARAFAEVRLSVLARAWGLLVESALQTLAFAFQALHALHLLRPVRGAGQGTPVVVLPGYTENSGTMWWLCRRLARAGFDVHPVDFPSTFARLELNVAFLRQRIAEIRAARGGREVAVVAHSMGGVITRALALSEPDHGILALVAFASPFRGTHMAGVGAALRLGHSVRQLCIDSPFMQQHGPERGVPMPTLCVVAPQEAIVTPEWSVVVEGAEVLVLPQAYGHGAPLFLSAPFELVRAWLLAQGVEPAVSSERAGPPVASTASDRPSGPAT